MSTAPAIIRVESLVKKFGEVTVLDDINLAISPGEIFGVIGKSGAGKSTLVRCINLLEKPSQGEIIFDGERLTAMPAPELYRVRRSMGMVFQQFNLLMQRTALGNVCFPMEIAGWRKAEIRQRATELLQLVGLPDKTDAYPAQLSGGQRQRVAIARAIALNPKVLLCDEATSALDPETTRGVLALLRDINDRFGITIVVITHEMQVVESLCHRVAILHQSRVAESGPVREIFANPSTEAGKKLVFPESEVLDEFSTGKRCHRVVFDGNSSFEPFVADLVLHFRQRVNILYADTKNIDGKAVGQMLLQLPDDPETASRMLEYMRVRGLQVGAEEVSL
jgi:D-methionine transport system ATP-binding protein